MRKRHKLTRRHSKKLFTKTAESKKVHLQKNANHQNDVCQKEFEKLA